MFTIARYWIGSGSSAKTAHRAEPLDLVQARGFARWNLGR
jgi:hypothetical protein